MALKGARTIVVRDQTFKWKFAHTTARYVGDSPFNGDIVVQGDSMHGRLRASVVSHRICPESDEGDYQHRASLTPKDVCRVIEKALDDGWQPAERGQHELLGPLKLADYSVEGIHGDSQDSLVVPDLIEHDSTSTIIRRIKN